MHQPRGFLDQKTKSPLSMGAAIAINGAVVGALLLANPEIVKRIPTVITATHIEAEKPKPVTDPPKPRVETQRPREQTVAITKSPVAKEESDFVKPFEFPPVGGGITGTDDGLIIEPIKPAHVPVLIGAKVNPRYADALQPPYPPGMQRIGMEGVVVVRVLVGADGRVKQVARVEAADDAFFKATEAQALKKWRFLPATRDGVAVEEWRTMTVRFRLTG